MSTEPNYNQPFHNHLVPVETLKLKVGTALRKWLDGAFKALSIDELTVGTSATISGLTASGATSLTDNVNFTANTEGLRQRTIVTTEATRALSTTESGRVFICTATSGTQIFTLPAASNAGVFFTFCAGHASSEIRLAVGTGDNIIGKTHGANDAVGISTTATTGVLINTAASNVVGDFVTVVADGTTSWYMIAVAGVWAAA